MHIKIEVDRIWKHLATKSPESTASGNVSKDTYEIKQNGFQKGIWDFKQKALQASGKSSEKIKASGSSIRKDFKASESQRRLI